MTDFWMEALEVLAPDEFDMAMIASGASAYPVAAVLDGPLPITDAGVVAAVGCGLAGRRMVGLAKLVGRTAAVRGRLIYHELLDRMAPHITYAQRIVDEALDDVRALDRRMHAARYSRDGYQLLRKKLPWRLSVTKASKALDTMSELGTSHIDVHVVNGRIDPSWINVHLDAARRSSTDVHLSDEQLESLQELATTLYEAGRNQLPGQLLEPGKPMWLMIRREVTENMVTGVHATSSVHTDGTRFFAGSFVRRRPGNPGGPVVGGRGTKLRVASEGGPGIADVEEGPVLFDDFPGTYGAVRQRQVVAVEGNLPHAGPTTLLPDEERLFVRLSMTARRH